MLKRFHLRVGDAGLQIKSLTIWILSHPNSIVDYDPNPIPTTISCRRSQFQYKFDLLLITVNHFWSNFDLLIKIRPKMID